MCCKDEDEVLAKVKVDGVDKLCDIAENWSDLAIVSSAFYTLWVDSASRLTEAQSLNLFVTFAVDLQKWHFITWTEKGKIPPV